MEHIVTKVNFCNPDTSKNQIGYLYTYNNLSYVRSYNEKVYSISADMIHTKFNSYKKSQKFIKNFFKLNT